MSSARILDVTAEQYHKLPGLSPSLAHVLLTRCALIARDKYERQIEPASEPEDSAGDEEEANDEPGEKVTNDKQKRLDRGTVLHSLALGKDAERLVVIPTSALGKGNKYSTNKSKELRDAARAAGRVPVKEPDMAMFQRTGDAIRAKLAARGHVLDGISELAIEWWEHTNLGEVQCRTRIDHVRLLDADGKLDHERPAFAQIFEVKFPDDAAPDRSERTSQQLSYEIACGARHRAINALFPSIAGRVEYRYLFCEPHRPYACWDPTPTGSFLELGDRKWRTAVYLWAQASKSGRWLDYSEDIARRQIDLLRWVKVQEGFTPDE